MTTFLPQDSENNPIPALRLKDSGAHKVTVTGTSAANSTAFDSDTRIISLYATEDIFVKLGTSGVAATTSDHFFPAGTYYDIAIGGDRVGHYTHIAAISNGTDGILYISEKE